MRDQVSRARDAGVTRILVPATTLDDAPRAVEVAERFDGVFAAVGVHPHETKGFDEDRVIPALERLAASAKVVAIGEIGLDYFYDFAPKEDQKRALVAQLKLAERLGKPVLLHNRESEEDLLAILEAEAKGSPEALRGVFHSFCASTATGEKAIALGYLVSYSGMITFQMAENVRESAAALPLEAMLVETDAPYLAPAPFRGKPNEPAYVGRTAARLAEVKGVSARGSRPGDDRELPEALRHAVRRRPPRPPRLSMAEFEKLVAEAVEGLPPEFQEMLENVVIAVEEEPEEEDYVETDTPDDEELFGIYRGPMRTEVGFDALPGPPAAGRRLPRPDPPLLRLEPRGGHGNPGHRPPRARPLLRARGRRDAVLTTGPLRMRVAPSSSPRCLAAVVVLGVRSAAWAEREASPLSDWHLWMETDEHAAVAAAARIAAGNLARRPGVPPLVLVAGAVRDSGRVGRRRPAEGRLPGARLPVPPRGGGRDGSRAGGRRPSRAAPPRDGGVRPSSPPRAPRSSCGPGRGPPLAVVAGAVAGVFHGTYAPLVFLTASSTATVRWRTSRRSSSRSRSSRRARRAREEGPVLGLLAGVRARS